MSVKQSPQLLFSLILNIVVSLSIIGTSVAQSSETTRISVASDGSEANGSSDTPTVSADGRYVAFLSTATNLVPEDTNNMPDVFVHDRETGETTRVSIASDGSQAWGGSDMPVISADGRYIAFLSTAWNLQPNYMEPGWTPDLYEDIFVHDRQTSLTTLISATSDGTQANGESWSPVISADGRYVMFASFAHNLVPNDGYASLDTFVFDRENSHMERMPFTIDSLATSEDERYVAFTSWDLELVPDDTNSERDVFVHERDVGEVTYSVFGQVTSSSGNCASNVTISADPNYSATTSVSGNYVLTALPAGTYTLTPSKTGCTFSPTSGTVTVPPNATGEDFVGSSMQSSVPDRVPVVFVPGTGEARYLLQMARSYGQRFGLSGVTRDIVV